MPTLARPVLGGIVVLTIIALGLLLGASEDPWTSIDHRAEAWGTEVEVEMDGTSLMTLRPYRLPHHQDGEACIAHRGDAGGSWCFVAGWQVETQVLRSEGQRVLVGVTPRDVATVRIPRDDGGVLEVEPVLDEAAGIRLFTQVLGDDLDEATVGNRISAHAADGTKLGNEHDRAEGFDFGPWDGARDRDDAPAV